MTNPVYPRAVWRITLDGNDITPRIAPRLMELHLTEARSDQADQLDITLSDHDGALELPPRNAVLDVALGLSDAGLIPKGRFTVDEIGWRGAPDTLTLRARSADLTSRLRERQERSYYNNTLEEIVMRVALEHDLEPVVGDSLKAIKVPHIDQTGESDISFLSRLGRRFDAVVTVKEGKLLFVAIKGAQSANGTPLPRYRIVRSDGDGYEFQVADRQSYTGVEATWMDAQAQTQRTVLAGTQGNVSRMLALYPNEADAQAAATAEWQRIQRWHATFRLKIAHGLPTLAVQHPVQLQGFKPQIDAIAWLVKQVTHTLNAQGLTSSVELEQLGDVSDFLADVQEIQHDT